MEDRYGGNVKQDFATAAWKKHTQNLLGFIVTPLEKGQEASNVKGRSSKTVWAVKQPDILLTSSKHNISSWD